MTKISQADAGHMMKMAAAHLRAQVEEIHGLREENIQLMQKLAHYEKRERAERIATTMEEKGLQPELSIQEKVAGLMTRDNLDVVEEAVGLSTPQMKLASVADDESVETDGFGGTADLAFFHNLSSEQ